MIVLINSNPVHEPKLRQLQEELNCMYIGAPDAFNALKPYPEDYQLFFFHWSWIIPASVYTRSECILFHMTDLPYGRGGSPLQNLIVRGKKETMVSALKVSKGLDTGPIYLKRPLSLAGTAREIFLRAGDLMIEMTRRIIKEKPEPVAQTGEPTLFQRRKPEDGDLATLETLEQAYDYIRMLDADGYPPAFIDAGPFRITFTRAARHSDRLLADAIIQLREDV